MKTQGILGTWIDARYRLDAISNGSSFSSSRFMWYVHVVIVLVGHSICLDNIEEE